MHTLDISKVMTARHLNNAEAREWVRHRLKDGYFWSRLNPDLLAGDELLPYVDADKPPQSPATLIPFPITRDNFRDIDPAASDFPEKLAKEKIRWCGAGARVGPAVFRRVVNQLAYYNPRPSTKGGYYQWLELNPLLSPLWPLTQMIFPALNKYSLPDPAFPEPPLHLPGEAWQSDQDAYGVKLRFSALQLKEGNLLAATLFGSKTYWLANYLLSSARYSFIRQQLFFLLGERMEPWQEDLPQESSFRGRIYRKPKW